MLRRYQAFRFYKNPALKVLLVADALVLTAAAMLTPIYAVFVQEVGGDLLDAGITAAALAFGSALASLVAGKYADGLRNKRMLIIASYAVTGMGFLLFTVVDGVWFLAAVQVMIGLVRAFAEPAYDALYSVHLDKKKEAEEWGEWEACRAAWRHCPGWSGRSDGSGNSFVHEFRHALYTYGQPLRGQRYIHVQSSK